jgi:hypothetical protein
MASFYTVIKCSLITLNNETNNFLIIRHRKLISISQNLKLIVNLKLQSITQREMSKNLLTI